MQDAPVSSETPSSARQAWFVLFPIVGGALLVVVTRVICHVYARHEEPNIGSHSIELFVCAVALWLASVTVSRYRAVVEKGGLVGADGKPPSLRFVRPVTVIAIAAALVFATIAAIGAGTWLGGTLK
jgi:hypothetical protein